MLRSVELELLLAEAEGEGHAEGEDAACKIVRAPPTGAAIFGPGTPKTVKIAGHSTSISATPQYPISVKIQEQFSEI